MKTIVLSSALFLTLIISNGQNTRINTSTLKVTTNNQVNSSTTNTNNNDYNNRVNNNTTNNNNNSYYYNNLNTWNSNNNNINSINSYSVNNNNKNQPSYIVKEEGFGSNIVKEDKIINVDNTNIYNNTNNLSNYKSNTAIDRFFLKNQKQSQFFTINAQEKSSLTGNDGTIIKIEPNSFINKNGELVQGDIEFELKEVYKKSAMILSNAHTVSNDIPLISGGEMYISANQNNEPLRLANDKPIAIEMPAQGNSEMQLFYGRANGSTVNWNLASNNTVKPILNASVSTGQSYNFSLNAMNWINCDKFIRSEKSNTKVKVNVPSQFDSTNTAIFIVLNNQNTVCKFDNFTQNIQTEKSSFDTKWYTIPTGANVTIVAIAQIDGKYYSSIEKTSIVKDHLADLIFKETTLEQFKYTMEQMP